MGKKKKASKSKDGNADAKDASLGADICGASQAQEDPSQVMNTLVGIIQQQQKQLEALQKIVMKNAAVGSAKVKENKSQGSKKKRPLETLDAGGKAVKETAPQGGKNKRLLTEQSYQDFGAKVQNVRDVKCWTCQLYGHIAKDCPKNSGGCYNCCQLDHRAADCPMGRSKQEACDKVQQDQKLDGVKCYACQKRGHIMKDCPQFSGGCFKCCQLGHQAVDCPMDKTKPEASNKVQLAQPVVHVPGKDQPKSDILLTKGSVSSQLLEDATRYKAVLPASVSVHHSDDDNASTGEDFEEVEEVNEGEPKGKEEELIQEEEQETGEEEEEPDEKEPFEDENISEEDPSEEDPSEEEPGEEEPGEEEVSNDEEILEESDQEASDEDPSENDDPVPTTAVRSTVSSAAQALLSCTTNPLKETEGTKLFVGYLPGSMTDDRLKQLFLPFGPIQEAVVIKEQNTGLSKGYGFVRYFDATVAARAVAQMNRYWIDGHSLTVRVAGNTSCPSTASITPGNSTNNVQSDSLAKLRNGLANKVMDETKLYVGSLPNSLNDDNLKQLFMPFGPIQESVVIKDKNTGLSKGYGFIRYFDATVAARAAAQMNGCWIGGHRLAVQVADSTSTASITPGNSTNNFHADSLAKLGNGLANQVMDETKLFVGSLPNSFNDDNLKQLFMPFGPIQEAVVIKDKSTGLSKGNGFIRYFDATDAARAVAQMNRYWIDGHRLVVQVADSTSCPSTASITLGNSTKNVQAGSLTKLGNELGNQVIDETKLFVGSLPKSFIDDNLRQLFMPFGQISEAVVIKDKIKGFSKGYGFVRFVEPASAAQALARMNGYQIEGMMLVVRVAGRPAATSSIHTYPLVLQSSLGQVPTSLFPGSAGQIRQLGSIGWAGSAIIDQMNAGPISRSGHQGPTSWPDPQYPCMPEFHASFPTRNDSFSPADPDSLQYPASFGLTLNRRLL